MKPIWIVDDDQSIRFVLEKALLRENLPTRSFTNPKDVLMALATASDDELPQILVSDIRMPGGSGLDLLDKVKAKLPGLPVIVMTAFSDLDSAVSAFQGGAFEYLAKPFDLPKAVELIRRAVEESQRESVTEERQLASPEMLGQAAAMQDVFRAIGRLSQSHVTVMITGESGSGKELVARLIHEQGPRADRPFMPVNCGAIPTELMESEFFGHKKGSFTGASADKIGLFQAAGGGTLFLDEVAELPLHMQVKLLRAIQEKAVRPVGVEKETPVDVRILSATHKDLAGLVAKGEFRQDLYYRINVIELRVPSLRERPQDIPLLADYNLDRLARSSGMPKPTLTKDALDALLEYSFPGNVRELENILERAMTLCEDNTIDVDDLRLPDYAPPPDKGKMSLEPYLDTIEKETIMKALEQTRYNKTAAAKLLGITFRALRYRLKKLGMD